jgi:hypothetical protein
MHARSYSLSRPKAAALCLTNNWGPGTILKSSAWKRFYKIGGPVRKGDLNIRCFVIDDNGTMIREVFLETLPEDVSVAI